MVTLTPQQSTRLRELLGDNTEIQPGLPNLPREKAVEAVTILEGISQAEAEARVAFERGENTGDVIVLP